MKRRSKAALEDDLRSHYADLQQLLCAAQQGKYVERYRRGTNLVLLEPDIARFFSSDKDVNQALRLVLKMNAIPLRKRRRASKQQG